MRGASRRLNDSPLLWDLAPQRRAAGGRRRRGPIRCAEALTSPGHQSLSCPRPQASSSRRLECAAPLDSRFRGDDRLLLTADNPFSLTEASRRRLAVCPVLSCIFGNKEGGSIIGYCSRKEFAWRMSRLNLDSKRHNAAIRRRDRRTIAPDGAAIPDSPRFATIAAKNVSESAATRRWRIPCHERKTK